MLQNRKADGIVVHLVLLLVYASFGSASSLRNETFVAPHGSRDVDCGAEENPCGTIQLGLERTLNNGTVWLDKGVCCLFSTARALLSCLGRCLHA
jgi:hypothetical protein